MGVSGTTSLRSFSIAVIKERVEEVSHGLASGSSKLDDLEGAMMLLYSGA